MVAVYSTLQQIENRKKNKTCLHSRSYQNTLLCRIGFPSTGQGLGAVGGSVVFDLGFELWSEVSDETLNRPCECFT